MASTPVVIVVTGAGRGIGLSFARAFSARPNHIVVGTTRNLERDSKALQDANCKVVTLDVTSDESTNALPQHLAKLGITHVDILINNSGVLVADKLDSPTVADDALKQFNTNALGPLRVTKALLPLLLKSSKKQVVNISSRMGSIADNQSGQFYGYRASKAAENAISVSLARDLYKDGVSLLLLHPGMIQTSMTKNQGDMGPDEAVERLIKLVDTKTIEDGFKFFHRDGQELPW